MVGKIRARKYIANTGQDSSQGNVDTLWTKQWDKQRDNGTNGGDPHEDDQKPAADDDRMSTEQSDKAMLLIQTESTTKDEDNDSASFLKQKRKRKVSLSPESDAQDTQDDSSNDGSIFSPSSSCGTTDNNVLLNNDCKPATDNRKPAAKVLLDDDQWTIDLSKLQEDDAITSASSLNQKQKVINYLEDDSSNDGFISNAKTTAQKVPLSPALSPLSSREPPQVQAPADKSNAGSGTTTGQSKRALTGTKWRYQFVNYHTQKNAEPFPDKKISLDPDWDPKLTMEAQKKKPAGAMSDADLNPDDVKQVLGARRELGPEANVYFVFDLGLFIHYACKFWGNYNQDQKLCVQVIYLLYTNARHEMGKSTHKTYKTRKRATASSKFYKYKWHHMFPKGVNGHPDYGIIPLVTILHSIMHFSYKVLLLNQDEMINIGLGATFMGFGEANYKWMLSAAVNAGLPKKLATDFAGHYRECKSNERENYHANGRIKSKNKRLGLPKWSRKLFNFGNQNSLGCSRPDVATRNRNNTIYNWTGTGDRMLIKGVTQ